MSLFAQHAPVTFINKNSWWNILSNAILVRGLSSPNWGFLGFSSAVRQMSGDLCTAPRIISLSPLSLATEVIDAKLVASGLCLGTRTRTGGTATLTKRCFGRSPWFRGQQVISLKFSGIFLSCKINARRSEHSPISSHYHHYHWLTDETDVTLGASGYWLGI